MKDERILKLQGAVLEKNQLENYMEKMAADHVIQKESNKQTYPIPRLNENFEVISYVYHLLNEHVKLGIRIHPAGEWLLDNFYSIEEMYQSVIKELPLKKYTRFLGIASGAYQGFARIYVVVSELIAYTDGKIDSKNLISFLKAYQNKKTLSMEEIWNIGIFIQIALMENIREICEKIYSSQMQKYKVENMIERLVEEKGKDELKYQNLSMYRSKALGYGEMKYPFIEYLSYKLKRYGRKAYPFMEVLEEQVNKMGTTVSDVIKKEHFDIATKRVSMGNCITSIKTLRRIDFQEIFEILNGVEDILRKDPSKVYDKMDYKTKEYYRNKIKEISKKTKVSELYIAKKIVDFAEKADLEDEKERHVGYYLIGDGEEILLSDLYGRKVRKMSKKSKVLLYTSSIWIISILSIIWLLAYMPINIVVKVLLGISILIPIQNIVMQIIQYLLGKIVKPKLIPKLDLSSGIPKEDTTYVVIPTIIKDPKRVKELMKKLEVYYLANKSDNIYFALLGDASTSKNETEEFDEELIKTGLEEAKRLNEKYKNEEEKRFSFYYRKRRWCDGEEAYLGWERKRGLLHEFNSLLLGEETYLEDFHTCPQKEENYKKITPKYVITLDADTDLVLNTGLQLIGAMSHILNKPVLNEKGNLVIEGHGIMEPRVGIDLVSCRKSIFTKLFAGNGGTDSYTNAIFDVYQDNFDEGIFAGKGIYDLNVFKNVMENQIPENTVLSHDLLEGSYLRCALVSDIELMDGYPVGYNSYKSRLHRWIRGDFQITRWLKKNIKLKDGTKEKNPLGILSKYKIFDNLIRSLNEPFVIISLLILVIINLLINVKIWYIVTVLLISVIISSIIEIINKIVSKKDGEHTQKTFTNNIPKIWASILRAIIAVAVLPDKAYMSINAILKTCYRKHISKKHLLEWTTAEEAEKNSKHTIGAYYKNMFPNIILGVIAICYGMINKKITMIIIGTVWILAPIFMQSISKKAKRNIPFESLNKEEKEYLYKIGKETWTFFKDYLTEENNYLMPDNYQEDRHPKIIDRTSSTNIGLSMLAVISAYDMGYEKKDDMINLLYKILVSVDSLPKWNGHLYNWYQTKTAQILLPKYVSTVDSGNFVGYMYVVKDFLEKIEETEEIKHMKEITNRIIENSDFSKLYDEDTRLFSIGFNVEEGKLTDSYYDLLASEARQASLVAIAKKDVNEKHWYNLSRTLTTLGKYQGLISWSGTSFEYLMPNINIVKYPGSLLDESCKFMITSQQEYTKKLGIPWGISESAFNLKDLNNNYQYKAFGIPWLGLKRGLADEMVVSSYGSMMALPDIPKEVIKNIKILENQKMRGKYGFYESIDYTPIRMKKGRKYEPVKTYMAHHQGLILLSINNLFNDNILQKRFMDNPELEAVDILLQERTPEKLIITKEEKEKVEKIKYQDYENYIERVYTKLDERLIKTNVIGNGEYNVVMNQKGEGYSNWKNILINRYKETDDERQGIFFFIKNVNQKRIWSAGKASFLSDADKYNVTFAEDVDKIYRQDGNIETLQKVTVSPDSQVEIRSLHLKNQGINEEILEITSFFEPVLSNKEQDYSHKAFNNLFLTYEYLEDINSILIKRKKRGKNEKEVYLLASLYTEGNTIGEFEFELDKEKFYGRDNVKLPIMIQNSVPLSKKVGLNVEPIVAMKRTIKLMKEEETSIHLILSVSESRETAIKQAKEYLNTSYITRAYELARARVEAESAYLGLKGTNIACYQNLLRYLIYQNPLKSIDISKYENCKFSKEDLWKYGISGDLPILLVKIKDVNDIEVIKEVLKAYEFYKAKNIEIDLVIYHEEKHQYENYVLEAIQNEILNKNLAYMQNIRGGIYIIEDNEDRELLEYRANFIIDAHLGNIEDTIKDLEEEYLKKYINIPNKPIKTLPTMKEERIENILPTNDMKYYNEYGGFSKEGNEYLIRINKNHLLPTVWSNIIANPCFGTLVTETMGGFTWYKNSRLNRITSWSNNQVTDIPSEIIYAEDLETGKKWSLGYNPLPDKNDYYITHGWGYSKFAHESSGLKQDLTVFVAQNEPVKINILNLKNTMPKRRKIRLIYYVKPVLGEDEIKTIGNINLIYDENNNICMARKVYDEEIKTTMFITSSEKINSYTGDKNFFFGQGDLSYPDALRKQELNMENSLGKNPIIAIEIEVEIEAYGKKEISFLLGAGEEEIICRNLGYKYSKIQNCKYEIENVKRYWKEINSRLTVKTPIESTNIMLNGWLIYQVIQSRLYAKSAFYQSGGAIGFRDQLQDCLGLKYINPNYMKEEILIHSQKQFLEGDVLHWWHEQTGRGIRTRFSDDLLWLCYVTAEYVNFTGDEAILDIKTPYLVGETLENGIDEKYDFYAKSEIEESIYMHCKRAINHSFKFGENGLPKIGSGDWNDGFSEVGNKGKGESVWLGFFLYDILNKFVPICRKRGDEETANEYIQNMEKLKKALNSNGWDGRWYKRAFMDTGEMLRKYTK